MFLIEPFVVGIKQSHISIARNSHSATAKPSVIKFTVFKKVNDKAQILVDRFLFPA